MGKIAFVFSGQGAQYSGMGKDFFDTSPLAQELFNLAVTIRPNTAAQCFYGTKEELLQTINTQPCLFTVDVVAATVLKERGIVPDMVAGFSLGELAAISFCGMLPFKDMFEFVIKRAIYMDECATCSFGIMIAVLGLDATMIEKISRRYANCYVANYNSPLQTVVACSDDTAVQFISDIKASGGKAIKLAVSGGFHSPFMDTAYDKLKLEFDKIKFMPPTIPIYSNISGSLYGDVSDMFLQVKSPVLWQKTIENMIEDGADTFIEVGAGKTLCGLIKKINNSVTVLNVEDNKSLLNTLEVLNNAKR